MNIIATAQAVCLTMRIMCLRVLHEMTSWLQGVLCPNELFRDNEASFPVGDQLREVLLLLCGSLLRRTWLFIEDPRSGLLESIGRHNGRGIGAFRCSGSCGRVSTVPRLTQCFLITLACLHSRPEVLDGQHKPLSSLSNCMHIGLISNVLTVSAFRLTARARRRRILAQPYSKGRSRQTA